VVLVIDTSSHRSALALVAGGEALAEDVVMDGRERDLPERVLAIVEPRRVEAVAVAVGPGSFTGLRVGVSYGVGLAMGLRVPLLGFGSLDLQAARTGRAATAAVDAGRRRLYWREPGAEPRLGAPAELPRELPVVGWLRPDTAEAVRVAGLLLLPDEALAGFAQTAAMLVGSAARLGYDTVELRYMQSFRPMRESRG